jgi:hypothetical protein
MHLCVLASFLAVLVQAAAWVLLADVQPLRDVGSLAQQHLTVQTAEWQQFGSPSISYMTIANSVWFGGCNTAPGQQVCGASAPQLQASKCCQSSCAVPLSGVCASIGPLGSTIPKGTMVTLYVTACVC